MKMSDEVTTHHCLHCNYSWKHGTNGRHDCKVLLKKRIAQLEKWQRDMVAKVADKSLEGYREMGKTIARLEMDNDLKKRNQIKLLTKVKVLQRRLRSIRECAIHDPNEDIDVALSWLCTQIQALTKEDTL